MSRIAKTPSACLDELDEYFQRQPRASNPKSEQRPVPITEPFPALSAAATWLAMNCGPAQAQDRTNFCDDATGRSFFDAAGAVVRHPCIATIGKR